MLLETTRLKIRPWHKNDLQEFHTIWSDPEVIWWGPSQNLSESQEVLTRQIQAARKRPPGLGWLAVIEQAGIIVGNIFLQPAKSLPSKIEIGWHFRRSSQGQGFATEAAKALLAFGFETLKLEEVIAPIVPTNQASRRVAEKLGMQPKLQIEYAGYLHDIWFMTRSESKLVVETSGE